MYPGSTVLYRLEKEERKRKARRSRYTTNMVTGFNLKSFTAVALETSSLLVQVLRVATRNQSAPAALATSHRECLPLLF
jgi:hypothetical protein